VTELVPVGRVGKPHGLDGSFFVEGASDDASRFAAGSEIFVDGEPHRIASAKKARGRPVIRLEGEVRRGATLAVARESLPEPEQDAFYVFQLVGLTVEEDGGRVLGRVVDVVDYPANDVLELDSGLSLPLVETCVREIDLERRRIVVSSGFADPL
jgi:16S rRNA processing protein RimM